jgi:hypothetical protein
VLSFPAMSDASFNNPSPQFGTAEYVGSSGNDHCQFCHQPVAGTYYRINDAMSCPGCAEKMRGELAKDTHAAFVRGILFGIGAAIVGMILYATFAITTGIIIGYVSLAVGWMVGKAITKGSAGVGGRRYQIAAAVLTYAAVSMAAVPIWIHYAGKGRQEQKQQMAARGQEKQQTPDSEFERQEQKANPNYHSDVNSDVNTNVNSNRNVARPGRLEALAKLAMIGIASPVIEVWETGPSLSWGIGIFILILGIRIAWKMTAGEPLQIHGPFESSQPAS